MRNRSTTLAVLVTALTLTGAAALADSWLGADETVASGPAYQAPAIAIDPAGASPVRAVVGFASSASPGKISVSRASPATWDGPPIPSWSASSTAIASASLGDPALTWGSGSTVYAVAERPVSASPCLTPNGLQLAISTNAGSTFPTLTSFAPAAEAREPSIAYDASTTTPFEYVAYSRLTGSPCGITSEIVVAVMERNGDFNRPIAVLGGAAQDREPAIAVTGPGRFVVAFRDTTGSRDDIATVACQVMPDSCSAPIVVATGTAATDAQPAIAVAGGRVVVAWQAGDGSAARVRSATSLNGGASFGPSTALDGAAFAQTSPRLAAAGNGRIDAAYLGGGSIRSVSSLAGGASEQWSTPVTVTAGSPLDPGTRLGLATSTIPTSLPRTLVAWSTLAGEIHLVPILHGTATPTVTPGQTFSVPKGGSADLSIDARDADGDPLTYAVKTPPVSPGSSAAFTVPTRSSMSVRGGGTTRTEQIEVQVTDGVNQGTGTVAVNITNDPPEIICSTLVVAAGKDLPIDPAGCAEDANGDPLTFVLSDPDGGKLDHTGGRYTFISTAGSKRGSFLLQVSDGEATVQARVAVTVASSDSKVGLTVVGGEGLRSVYVGAAVRLRATGTDPTGRSLPVSWDFGDGSPRSRGGSITHAYAKPGLWYVVVSTTSTARRIQVRTYRRPLALVGALRFADAHHLAVALQATLNGTVTIRVAGVAGHVKMPMRAGAAIRTVRIPTGMLAHRGTIELIASFAPTGKAPLPIAQVRRVVSVPAGLRR